MYARKIIIFYELYLNRFLLAFMVSKWRNVMKDNIEEFKKKWIENSSDEKGVLLYLPVSEVFVSAKFGTGENLLKEDIARGFDEYIYVKKLVFDEDELVELDTAQLDFNSGKEDYYLNLIHFCEESIEMMGNSLEEEYWILQMI